MKGFLLWLHCCLIHGYVRYPLDALQLLQARHPGLTMFIATYLGGAGYHMSQLNEYHIARLTQVRIPPIQSKRGAMADTPLPQSFLVIESLYGLSMCTVKWSILFMFKRIFAVRYFKVCDFPYLGLDLAPHNRDCFLRIFFADE